MAVQKQGELEPIRDADVAERLRQVSFDGPFGDIEPARNLLVARASTDQIRDHALARGQAFEAGLELRLNLFLLLAVDEGQKLSDEPCNEISRGPDLASLDRCHRFLEVLGIYG